MLALVDGQPQTLPLKAVLAHYIEFRREVVRRRTEYDLEKARARAHILEGLKIALDNLDEVIKTIRASADVDKARANLMTGFGLSEIQAQAILDMRLAPPRRPRAQEDRRRVPRGDQGDRRLEDIRLTRLGSSRNQGRARRPQDQVLRRPTHADRRRLQPRDDR